MKDLLNVAPLVLNIVELSGCFRSEPLRGRLTALMSVIDDRLALGDADLKNLGNLVGFITAKLSF